MTPGEYKNLGEQLTIEYGFHATPFGECLLSTTERGICGLDFVRNGRPESELESVTKKWPHARFVENTSSTAPLIEKIFTCGGSKRQVPFHLFLKGTNFQLKVWEALLKVPYARVVSYHDIAHEIGEPKAVRAVANAIGSNPVPFLIPCHRVIRKLGEFGGYGGGTARKKAIIGWEVAKMQSAA